MNRCLLSDLQNSGLINGPERVKAYWDDIFLIHKYGSVVAVFIVVVYCSLLLLNALKYTVAGYSRISEP